MKTLIKIAILLIMSYNLYSQNTEPAAFEFNYGTNSFTQSKFIYGFQWAASKNMNDALMNTAYAGGIYINELNNNSDPLDMIISPKWMNFGHNPGFWYAPFMNYEPTLPLNSDGSNFGTILRLADGSNPIFGFKYRRVEPSTNPTDVNYPRMVLVKSLASSSEKIVLNNIIPKPATDYITLNINGINTTLKRGVEVDMLIEIYNVMGILIHSTPSASQPPLNEGNFKIDISSLAPDIYFVKMVASNGCCSIVEKFVKIKS